MRISYNCAGNAVLVTPRALTKPTYQEVNMANYNIRHGHARRSAPSTPEYVAWFHMRARCLNPNDIGYHRYGGRGITITEKWAKFEGFLEDMGLRPSPKHSLDRIDNDGNYEPSNCRWATSKQQAENRSSNVMIEFNGERKMMATWAKELNFNRDTVTYRLEQGWSIDEAFTTPLHARRRR